MTSPVRPWIFGYGSLIFRPDFPFLDRRRAVLRGWARRFWQGSPDHRGTPDRPGRVVTLVPHPPGSVVGLAYRVGADTAARILAALDHREQAGYVRHDLPLVLDDGSVDSPRVFGITYVATADNPDFAGPADLATIARRVATCTGPSGTNTDYVLALSDALRDLGDTADPSHVLAQHLRELADRAP